MANARVMEFTATLDRWATRLDGRLLELLLNVIMLFFKNVVVGGNYSPGTPVDTGFARNSWVAGINGIGAFRQPSTDPNRQPRRDGEREQIYPTVSVDEGQIALLDMKLGDEVHLTSNAAYMGALDDGHSGKAPNGMIALAILAAQLMVDEVAREMLR